MAAVLAGNVELAVTRAVHAHTFRRLPERVGVPSHQHSSLVPACISGAEPYARAAGARRRDHPGATAHYVTEGSRRGPDHREQDVARVIASPFDRGAWQRSVATSNGSSLHVQSGGTGTAVIVHESPLSVSGDIGLARSTPRTLFGKVGFYDTTLRDGEQTVGVVLSPEDKLELARGLDAPRDRAHRSRLPACLERRLARGRAHSRRRPERRGLGFSRAVEADVKALVELGVGASVIESPISDLKLARSASIARRCSSGSSTRSRSRSNRA